MERKLLRLNYVKARGQRDPVPCMCTNVVWQRPDGTRSTSRFPARLTPQEAVSCAEGVESRVRRGART